MNGNKNNDSKDVKFALDYHEGTKHSQLSVHMSRHYLDFDDKPLPFKIYPNLPPIPLPQDFAIPVSNGLACIRGSTDIVTPESQNPPSSSSLPIDIRTLAQLLFFSAGITREMKFDSGTYYMRAASATGALYPIELYVIISSKSGLSGLSAGVYHFCPSDFSLVKLRDGDYTTKLSEATACNSDILSAPITLAFTSMAWRNAWKYGDRSYRHWFWDSGVIAANLLAVALSIGLRPVPLVMGFVDSQVNELLCLKQDKEAAVVLAPLVPLSFHGSTKMDYHSADSATNAQSIKAETCPEYLALSKSEVDHPEIWKIHKASSLSTSEEVVEWLLGATSFIRATTSRISPLRQHGINKKEEIKSAKSTGLLQSEHPESNLSIGDVILRRGSTRRFSRSAAISKSSLLTILHTSTRGVPLDFLNGEPKSSLLDIYLIANAVDGLSSGSYYYNRTLNLLVQLEIKNENASRSESGYLCLEQPLFSDACAVLFVMANLEAVLKGLGNRGYRASQFEAGVVAGKIYLSSYALGLGASGSTFYDDAVTECFSSHAKDKATMIAIGVGVPAYKAQPGKLLAARLTRMDQLLPETMGGIRRRMK